MQRAFSAGLARTLPAFHFLSSYKTVTTLEVKTFWALRVFVLSRLKRVDAKPAGTCQPHGPAVDAPPEAFLLAERRSPVCFAVAVLLVVAHLRKHSFIRFERPDGSTSSQRGALGSSYPEETSPQHSKGLVRTRAKARDRVNT